MFTVGVDLAAEPKKTALATVSWRADGASLGHLQVGVDDGTVIDRSRGAGSVGIDCAFGWPIEFVEFVTAHAAESLPRRNESGLAWRRRLVYRHTDRFVRDLTGQRPLSIATDRLGLTACGVPGEWNGKQVRISSGAQITQLEGLGGSPTSLEYTKTYEALQWGTVDCTLSATLPATTSGFLEVAPNVSYTDEVTFARGPGATVACSAYENYPLAVKQLLFDAMLRDFNTSRRADLEGNSLAAQQVREFDASFHAMAEDAEDSLKEASQDVVQAEVEKGSLPESTEQDVADLMERWSGAAEELGYADDEGEFENYDEWYNPDQDYLMPYSERYFDEVVLPHRPS